MTKHVKSSEGKGRNLLITSAAFAAMIMPLSYASPSVSIERAEYALASHAHEKGASQIPSRNELDSARTRLEEERKIYQKKLQEFNALKANIIPQDKYQGIISEQDLNVENQAKQIQPLLEQIKSINEDIIRINKQNNEDISGLQDAYDTSYKALQSAEAEMLNHQINLTNKIKDNELKIQQLSDKASAAREDFENKKTEFESFKATYEQSLASYNSDVLIYEAKLADIKSNIKSLEKQIESLPTDNNKGYKEAQQNRESILNKINALKVEYKKESTRFNQITQAFDQTKNKYSNLEKSYLNAKSAVDIANEEIQRTNLLIIQENNTLKDKCNESQNKYEEVKKAHKKLSETYEKQIKTAASKNKENNQLYSDLENKVNELTVMVNEYNNEREKISGDIQNTKALVDSAYSTVMEAYNSLKKLNDTTVKLAEEYNTAADSYNAQMQKDYNKKLSDYNEAHAKFKADVAKMKEDTHKFGNLVKPAWQGLSFGNGGPRKIENGGLTWINGSAPTVIEGNKLYTEIAPQESAVAVYSGNAVEGITFAGKQIDSMRVTYLNCNEEKPELDNSANGPVYIGADADIRMGFDACYKITNRNIQEPMRPGSQFSYQSDTPLGNHFFKKLVIGGRQDIVIGQSQAIIVVIELFDQQGNPITFSKETPADIYFPDMYRVKAANGGVDYFKSMSASNFDEIIPIKGATIKENQVVKGYSPLNPYVPFDATTPITVNAEYTPKNQPVTWDDINNPDFYKSCYMGVKDNGTDIAFNLVKNVIPISGSSEVRNYPKANETGFTQYFLANIPSVPLPLVPSNEKPEPPVFIKPLEISSNELGDKPEAIDIKVPSFNKLKTPDSPDVLETIKPKSISNVDKHKAPTCPAPTKTLPLLENVKDISNTMSPLPHAPEVLPAVPLVPQIKIPEANGGEITVMVGTPVTEKMLGDEITSEGKIKSIEPVDGAVDTSKPGVEDVKVKVTFEDNTGREVVVRVNVIDAPEADGGEITVMVGTPVTEKMLGDEITSEGKIKSIEPVDGAVDTSKPGVEDVKVKVTFEDNTVREVVVRVNVIDAPEDKKEITNSSNSMTVKKSTSKHDATPNTSDKSSVVPIVVLGFISTLMIKIGLKTINKED